MANKMYNDELLFYEAQFELKKVILTWELKIGLHPI